MQALESTYEKTIAYTAYLTFALIIRGVWYKGAGIAAAGKQTIDERACCMDECPINL